MNNTTQNALPKSVEAQKKYLETKLELLQHQIAGDVKGIKNSLAPENLLEQLTQKMLFPHLSEANQPSGKERSDWMERGIAAGVSLLLIRLFPKRVRGVMRVVAPVVAAATAPAIRRRIVAFMEKRTNPKTPPAETTEADTPPETTQ